MVEEVKGGQRLFVTNIRYRRSLFMCRPAYGSLSLHGMRARGEWGEKISCLILHEIRYRNIDRK